jgi:hypothetical protein
MSIMPQLGCNPYRGRTETIWCCGCGKHVGARLTNGAEIYPTRPDLHKLPFWRCPFCKNHVGCHHKSKNPTTPLGSIPTPQLRALRKEIHARLDPLWQSGIIERKALYALLSKQLGRQYHTAEINSHIEAELIFAALHRIAPSDFP